MVVDLAPIGVAVFYPLVVGSNQSGEQCVGALVNATERKKLQRPIGNAAPFKFSEFPEYRNESYEHLCKLGPVIAVVIQESEGRRRSNGIPIKVSEHLLAASESDIDEKHD